MISVNTHLDHSVFKIEKSENSVADSILRLSSYVSRIPWVVSNQNKLENDNYKIGSAGYSAAFLGDPLNSYISTNPWAVTNLRHIDKSVFQIESTGYSVANSMIRLGSHVASSPWVVSNQNKLENDNYKIGSAGYSAAFLGDPLNSYISTNPWAVTNLRHIDKSVFQIESTGYSVADSMVRLGSHVASSPWVVSNQNNLENECYKTGSAGYSETVLGNQLNSYISKSQCVVSTLSHFDNGVFQIESTRSVADSMVRLGSHIMRSPRVGSINDFYPNEVFKLGSANYPNSSSIGEANFKCFNSFVINPNHYSSEYGIIQVKKTEYPWLASNLSSWAPSVNSLSVTTSNSVNITRTSIIEHDDNGLFTSARPFRIYEPLDNYTLNTLKNTLESTIQKFKDHSPVQRYCLGFEKGQQITVINIFIVQGDVIGDNHHFGDKNYYLNQ